MMGLHSVQKMYPWGFLFGDYFRLTSGLLLAYFGLTWFSWVGLGHQIDANVVLGEISSGVGFLVRGRDGWKAKVSFSCESACKKYNSP